MSNILITSAGRRVELVESFKEEGRKLDIDLRLIIILNIYNQKGDDKDNR